MIVLGPVPCSRCGKSVEWERVGEQYRLIERHPRTLRTHICRAAGGHRHRWFSGTRCLDCGITKGRLARKAGDWYAARRALAIEAAR